MGFVRNQPAGIGAALAAIYAALTMLWRLADGEPGAVLSVDVALAGLFALYELWTWFVVTPLSRPRDKQGRELRPAQQPPPTRMGA